MAQPRREAIGSRRRLLKAGDVNLLLELCVIGAILSGLASWWLGDRWSGWAVLGHRVAGLGLLVLTPAKLRGPVRAGLRRRRSTRWVSIGFGVLTLATVVLGILHATGLWRGVGYWSPLWTHQLFAFLLIPLLIWHMVGRPVRPHLTDLDRRAVLRGGVVAGAAAGLVVGQEIMARMAGLSGRNRRFTGSHEVGSFNPSEMPSTVWIDDRRPESVSPDTWPLTVDGQPVTIGSLLERATPIVAILDCTGGWYSEQSWDAVPVSQLIGRPGGRSVRIRSATGYTRLFSHHELADVHLAVGYGGEPLRARHGGPARLVVPGQRGPMWVKWVTSIESDGRPPWLQAPLPLT